MGRKPILRPSDLFLNFLNCSGDGWDALEYGSTSVARTILQLKAELERFRDNSTLKQALEVQIEELKETTSNVKKQLELELRNIERLKLQSVSVQIGEKEIASIEEIGRLFQRNRKETAISQRQIPLWETPWPKDKEFAWFGMSRHYVFSNASDPWVQVIQFQWAQAPFDRLMAHSTLEWIFGVSVRCRLQCTKGSEHFKRLGVKA